MSKHRVSPVVLAGVVAAAALCGAVQAQAQSASSSCRASLGDLMSAWNAISFTPPSKPGQAVVSGLKGHSTTGGQYQYMEALIRRARMDCDRGDAGVSIERVTALRRLLNATHMSNG
jgi:hypothetical protein